MYKFNLNPNNLGFDSSFIWIIIINIEKYSYKWKMETSTYVSLMENLIKRETLTQFKSNKVQQTSIQLFKNMTSA